MSVQSKFEELTKRIAALEAKPAEITVAAKGFSAIDLANELPELDLHKNNVMVFNEKESASPDQVKMPNEKSIDDIISTVYADIDRANISVSSELGDGNHINIVRLSKS